MADRQVVPGEAQVKFVAEAGAARRKRSSSAAAGTARRAASDGIVAVAGSAPKRGKEGLGGWGGLTGVLTRDK